MICPQTDHVFKTGPTEKFLSNKRSTRINSPELKFKNQIIAYRWTFEKDSQKLDKFCDQPTINCGTIDDGVTVDRQKNSFIKPGES